MKTNWKIIAIIFIILFIAETFLIIWGIVLVNQEDRDIKECYYDVCGEYADAELIDGVCVCYTYDVIGNLIPGKTEVIR